MPNDQNLISRASGPRFILEANSRAARGYVFPVLLGVIGAAILCALGVWQLQRLDWKQNILAEIETRLAADIVGLPGELSSDNDNYRGVEVGGQLGDTELHVLTSMKPDGPGFRVIRKLETLDERLIMVDLGFVPEAKKADLRTVGAVFVEGNLLWPDETDVFTPLPNTDRNIWFAREVKAMSEALGTQPILVVARTTVPELETTPMPVTVNIPNNHLEYAVTWFGLMVVWILMTLFLLWRIKRDNA